MAKKKSSLNQYGICTNKGKCHMADERVRQEVPINKPFVCSNPDCGKPLMKVAPPKEKNNGKIWLIVGIVVIAGAIAWGLIALLGHKGESLEQPYQEGEPVEITEGADSLALAPVEPEEVVGAEPEEVTPLEEVVEEPVNEPVQTPTSGNGQGAASISVPFGTYSGPANGLDGEIRVTRAYSLDLRNAAHETLDLQPGDVITKTKFKNGELVGGYWKRGSEGRSFHR